jgi:hypothetical protein
MRAPRFYLSSAITEHHQQIANDPNTVTTGAPPAVAARQAAPFSAPLRASTAASAKWSRSHALTRRLGQRGR